jgi:hypothetical protein
MNPGSQVVPHHRIVLEFGQAYRIWQITSCLLRKKYRNENQEDDKK